MEQQYHQGQKFSQPVFFLGSERKKFVAKNSCFVFVFLTWIVKSCMILNLKTYHSQCTILGTCFFFDLFCFTLFKQDQVQKSTTLNPTTFAKQPRQHKLFVVPWRCGTFQATMNLQIWILMIQILLVGIRRGYWHGFLSILGFKWGFPEMVVPNNQGFPTKNDHFGVFWGYHHLRKPPNAKAFFQTFNETHIFVSLGM